MKKSLSCADMGVATCTFEARSENTTEIKDAIFAHFVKFHPEQASKVTEQQKKEMSQLMDKKIR